MTYDEAKSLLPRFMKAIDALAMSESSLRSRLPYAIEEIRAFSIVEIPDAIRSQFEELRQLLDSSSVPMEAANHPVYHRTQRAYYLTPKQVRRTAALIMEMFSSVVWALTVLHDGSVS